MQTLREELELVRSEKDQLSASMKDVIQGAESYKVRIVLCLRKTVNCQKILCFWSLAWIYILLFTCTSMFGKRNYASAVEYPNQEKWGSSNRIVRLLSEENKAVPFYWMVFLNLVNLASYVSINVLLRQNINPYEFFKVHTW